MAIGSQGVCFGWHSHGFDFPPLAAPSSTEKLGDFSEDCLRSENPSSAAAQLFEAALEISGSGVAFFLDTFSWLSKKKYLASRAKVTSNKLQNGFPLSRE